VPQPLNAATKAKISMFCHVAPEQVLGIHDMSSVYHVPLLLQSQGIVEYLDKRLKLGVLNGGNGQVKVDEKTKELGRILGARWKELTTRSVIFQNVKFYLLYVFYRQERVYDSVTIALVGKYTDLKDSYMSVIKALEHSALKVSRKLIIEVSDRLIN